MATATAKARCITCNKEKSAVRCEGCLQIFCYNHLNDHRQELDKQFDEIEINRDLFRQTLTERTNNSQKCLLIKTIDEWEEDSIKKIQQTANQCKQILFQYTTEHITQIEINLTKFTDQLRQTRQENDFNELDLTQFKDKLTQLIQELDKPSNISIDQNSTSLINNISVIISSEKDTEVVEKLDQSCQEQHKEKFQNELEMLRMKLNEINTNHEAYIALQVSFDELEKRCIKHQKNEIEAKQQMNVYQTSVNDLENEIQGLTERLSNGAEEYKVLYGKYTALENNMMKTNYQQDMTTTLSNKSIVDKDKLVSNHQNVYENEQDHKKETTSIQDASIDIDDEVLQCPMCYWEFPQNMSVEDKNKHIEDHFA